MTIAPCQHLDTSEAIGNCKIRLLIYGVPRSASSYTWQVLKDIYNEGIIRTHELLNLSASIPVLITIRDWRDAVVSCWRCHYPEAQEMDLEAMWNYVATYQRNIWIYRIWLRRKSKVIVLRFEDSMQNPSLVFDHANYLIPHGLTKSEQICILDRHTPLINRGITLGFENTDIDLETLLRVNHVHEAAEGSWKRFIPKNRQDYFTSLLKEPLEFDGYI